LCRWIVYCLFLQQSEEKALTLTLEPFHSANIKAHVIRNFPCFGRELQDEVCVWANSSRCREGVGILDVASRC
jgi:hypothetical protein